MATLNEVKFILDRPQSNTATYYCCIGSTTTGYKIHPEHWNSELQRARSTVRELVNRLLLAGEPMTTEGLKQYLNQKFGSTTSVKAVRVTFAMFMAKFIADIETGKRLTKQSHNYSPEQF